MPHVGCPELFREHLRAVEGISKPLLLPPTTIFFFLKRLVKVSVNASKVQSLQPTNGAMTNSKGPGKRQNHGLEGELQGVEILEACGEIF